MKSSANLIFPKESRALRSSFYRDCIFYRREPLAIYDCFLLKFFLLRCLFVPGLNFISIEVKLHPTMRGYKQMQHRTPAILAESFFVKCSFVKILASEKGRPQKCLNNSFAEKTLCFPWF